MKIVGVAYLTTPKFRRFFANFIWAVGFDLVYGSNPTATGPAETDLTGARSTADGAVRRMAGHLAPRLAPTSRTGRRCGAAVPG